MAKRLAPSVVTLVYDATLKSFWRRNSLSRFLRQAGVAQTFISTWDSQESKRQFLDRLFSRLPDQAKGQELILAIAHDLAQQEAFPDLLGWEDSEKKQQDARAAVMALRRAVSKLDEEVVSAKDREAAQRRLRQLHEESRRSRRTLESLSQRLNDLAPQIGSKTLGTPFRNGSTT